jgi:hypothetical protein
MWACYFFTAYFSRDDSMAGFQAEWKLLEVVPGRPGLYSMDHGRFLAGAAPAPSGTRVVESVTYPEDNYGVSQAFRTGNGPTDGRGVFGDSYRLGSRVSLPADFRLVMEQTYRVASDPVYDAVLLAGPHTTPVQSSLQAKNRVTYEADYPNLKILLQTNDGRGGWRFLWSDRSSRVTIERP